MLQKQIKAPPIHATPMRAAFEQAVQAGGWSPDGTAIVMTVAEFVGAPLPLKSLVFFRPGDTEMQVLPLTFYPWGPLSWY